MAGMNFEDLLNQEIVNVEETSASRELISLSEGEIDPRIKQLSYSSLQKLDTCPRRYQLYKLSAKEEELEDTGTSVTFAYGHVVGAGIQAVLCGKSERELWTDMFMAWNTNLFYFNKKQSKSFFEAVEAVMTFQRMWEGGWLNGWSLVSIDGTPAVELPFCIELQDGFMYRGFVDAVLVNDETREVMVLEIKTTSSATVNEAMYKNSFQAIGYSVVLDAAFPGMSAYTVMYLPYQTGKREFTPMPFTKYNADRAKWLRDLMFQVERIKLYEQDAAAGYPCNGAGCFNFFRPCEYFNSCGFTTANLTRPLTQADLERIEKDNFVYTHKFSIETLLNTQYERI